MPFASSCVIHRMSLDPILEKINKTDDYMALILYTRVVK